VIRRESLLLSVYVLEGLLSRLKFWGIFSALAYGQMSKQAQFPLLWPRNLILGKPGWANFQPADAKALKSKPFPPLPTRFGCL
jgi:hypothetical protein